MIKSSFICQYIETIWIVPLMTSPKIKGLLKWIGLNLRGQLYHIQHVPVQCFYLSEHITFSNLMVQCFTNMKSQHDIWKHANTISTSDYFIVYSIYGTSILLLFMCTSRYTLTMQCMGANVFGTLECSYRGWGGGGWGRMCDHKKLQCIFLYLLPYSLKTVLLKYLMTFMKNTHHLSARKIQMSPSVTKTISWWEHLMCLLNCRGTGSYNILIWHQYILPVNLI